MNRTLTAIVLIAAAFGSTVAHADNHGDARTVYPSSPAWQLTRAEVLADLKIYQESGLAAADRLYSEAALDTPQLHAARARYAQLRQSERYATLVTQIAQRTGEPVRAPRGA